MKSHVRIQKWLQPALCSLALIGSASIGYAQGVDDYIVDQFDDGAGARVSAWAYNYGGTVSTQEFDPAENRGPGANPGAMKVTIPFNLCTGNIQSDFEGLLLDTIDLTKYTKLHFSVKVDPSSSRLSVDWGAGDFGNMRPHVRNPDWNDSNMSTVGGDSQYIESDAYGNWMDYTKEIDHTIIPANIVSTVNRLGIDIWSGWGSCAMPGGHTNTVIFWLDNIWFEVNTNTTPPPPPTLGIRKAGPSGVEITVDNNGDQWQRDAIASPASPGNCFWNGYGSTPVTYSFTIADFPEPVAHEGFEAHLYIVNRDTSTAFDETYGGCDWNAPDIAIVSLASLADGTYTCQFQFKTNRPNNNPLDDPIHRPAMLTSSTVLGTWSLSFTDNTNVTMSGPGGILTNFTIPAEAVLNNFSPLTSFIQFGVHKNDNENDGHNNQTRATFSRIQKTGGDFVFDDTFNGPAYTSNYAWRKTSASAVQHVVPGTAWWLNWTLPADGFNVQSAVAVTGPWGDAGVTNRYTSAGKVHGSVLGSLLPGSSANYFRLIKRPFTKLQVLMPGETAAPNTATGKTGTPIEQGIGVSFNVTVNAVDDFWNRVPSTDTIAITSSDASATLPADGALFLGTRTFSVTFNASGSWTVTATDVTDGTKTPNTGTATTVP